MTRPASRHPTELELEILKVLWRGGEMRVRQVRSALAPRRELAYTSVMTIMNIMVDKGYLRRRRRGIGYAYRPRVTQKATTRRMLRDLMDRAFGGSPAAVMLNLLESAELDEAEIAELRSLLDRRSAEDPR
jgi:predicted transcriptional regulator